MESRTTGGSTTLAQATTTTYPNRQHTHTGTVDLGSGTAYASWPKEQGEGFTGTVEHAALDPFRGYANAIRDELPEAVAVLDAFHVVKVRHEALCVRMEVRDHHRLVVAAAGLKLRAA